MKLSTIFFILIPIIEIIVLLVFGSYLGIGWTVFLIFFTGIIGVYLAKKQGLQTIQRAKEQMSKGFMPGEEVFNGICILLGGFLLLLPGFISDLAGFLLLIPYTRKAFKPILYTLLTKYMNKTRKTITIIR
jgi:UPF0716 protein FxsA